MLSNYLIYFCQFGANILTISKTIPIECIAGVTISAETSDMKEGLDEMMAGISAAFKVLNEVLAG